MARSVKAAWQLENAIVGKFLQQYPEAADFRGVAFFFFVRRISGGELWDFGHFFGSSIF